MKIDNPNTEIFKEVDATVTTTKTLDWEAYGTFEYTMTGNTTFSDSNLPTGDKTNNVTIIITGNFTGTFPTYWEFFGDAYDGTVENTMACECIDGDNPNERVICTITNES